MRYLAMLLLLFTAGCGTTGTLNVSWGEPKAAAKADELPTIYLTPDQIQRMLEPSGKTPI